MERRRMFVYFEAVETAVILTFPSEAAATSAFSNITAAQTVGKPWSNNHKWLNTSKIRAISLEM